MAATDAYQLEVRERMLNLLSGGTIEQKWDVLRQWCFSRNYAFNRVAARVLQFTRARHAEQFNEHWNTQYDDAPYEIRTIRIDPAVHEAEQIDKWRELARQVEVRGQSKVRDAKKALERRGLSYENAKGQIVRPKEIADKKRIERNVD